MTRDIEAAVAWYRDVCGWTFETMEMEDGSAYHVAIAHGRPVAGITDMKMGYDKDEVPPRWFTYFAVDDVSPLPSDRVAPSVSETILSPALVPFPAQARKSPPPVVTLPKRSSAFVL